MNPETLRRILHVVSGGVVALGPFLSWSVLRTVLAAAAVLAVLVDLVRLSLPPVGRFLHRAVPVYRDSEQRRPSGAMWLAAGYALAAWTPAPAPLAGILVAACADPAASLVGGWRSVSSLAAKTWRGSLAHWLVAAGILLAVGASLPAVLAGASVATAVERWPLGLDDNLLIAPATALTIALVH